MYQITTLEAIHSLVKEEQGLQELKYFEFYPIQRRIFVQTPTGEARITHFVRKHGKKVVVALSDNSVLVGIDSHQLIGESTERVKISDLHVGALVQSASGLVSVSSIQEFNEEIDVFDITVDSNDHLFLTADGVWHHNTGKTQTVEQVLHDHGLSDGKGYFKITGSASPIGMYTMLYKYRDGVVLFDDCDGALETQDGRNIIKAATDTKKIRKVAWGKKNAGMYDPDSPAEMAKADAKADAKSRDEDSEEEDELEDDRVPRFFNFTGQVIFISNLPLNKLDPDGALRTRAFIISIDPTPDEILERMGQILNSIKLENGLTLSTKERQEVLSVIKAGKRKDEASLRTLVRALNLAASGAENWRALVQRYA